MGEQMQIPNRRWLRYSVRTLLIAVTIFCVWLGWQWRIVRERNSLRQHFADRVIFVDGPASLSWIRDAIGDRAVKIIQVPSPALIVGDLEPSELDSLQQAFPEAEVITGGIPLVG